MINKRALLTSVSINLFFLILSLVCGDLVFGAIDDYFMARLLEGVYGNEYNIHLTFVNAIYGYVLLPLYHLFPKVGWYYVGEITFVFISLTILAYVIIKRLDFWWGCLFSTLLVAALASDYYLVLQFTQCASVLTAAGFALLLDQIDKPQKSYNNVFLVLTIALLLMVWGSIMRLEAFFMGLPFLAVALCFSVKKCMRIRFPLIAIMILLTVSVLGCVCFNKAQYSSPEYQYYMDFQRPRAVFGDGRNYNDQAVYEDFEELGLYGPDFANLKSWKFYGNEAIVSGQINQILKLVQTHYKKVDVWSLPSATMGHLCACMKMPVFWLWMIVAGMLFWSRKKSSCKPWVVFVLILCLFAYLLTLDRLVYRVENGIWLYGTVILIPYMSINDWLSQFKKVPIVLVVLILFSNVFLFGWEGVMVRDPNTATKHTIVDYHDTLDYKSAFAYMDSLPPQSIFLTPHNTYMLFSFHHRPPYLSEEKGSWKSVIPLGFWTPYFPDIENVIHERGVENPMKDVVKENVYVFEEQTMRSYLKHHYNYETKIDTIRNFNGLILYKYSLVNVEGE